MNYSQGGIVIAGQWAVKCIVGLGAYQNIAALKAAYNQCVIKSALGVCELNDIAYGIYRLFIYKASVRS